MTALGESRGAVLGAGRSRAGRRAGLIGSLAVIAALAPASAAQAAGPPGANPQALAYEQVSPVFKAGGDILRWPTGIAAARDGGRVAFQSNSGFSEGGAGGVGLRAFSALRGGESWATDWLTPVTPPDIPQIFAGTQYKNFSEDGTKAILTAFNAPANPAGVPDAVNTYVQDVATGRLQALSTAETPLAPMTRFELAGYRAASSDLSHVLLESAEMLTDDATNSGRKVYESVNGRLRLASVLPDGTPAPDAVSVNFDFTVNASLQRRGTISRDGSRVLFHDVSTGQVYLRRNGETALVSRPEVGSPPATPLTSLAQGMSGDGRRVAIATTERLLPADTDSAYDLYLYTDSADPETDSNLRLLTPGTTDGDISSLGVLGIADDAERLWFVSNSTIDGTDPLPPQRVGLYLWKDGAPELVAIFDPQVSGLQDNWASDDTLIRTSRMSRDGRALLFTEPTGGPKRLLYFYDDPDDGPAAPVCVSCPGGGAPTSNGNLQTSNNDVLAGPTLYDPRNLTADGRTAFFETADRLVAEDQDDRSDVYAYDDESGEVSLITPGNSPDGSYFGDASDDGSSVFFWTRARLVGWDDDNGTDVYVARVGGGFPEPPPVGRPCEGEACQPPPGQPPRIVDPVPPGADEGNATDPEATLSLIRVTEAQRKKAAKSGRLVVKAKVNTAGKVTAEATTRVNRKLVTAASVSRTVASGRTVSLTLRLSRAARRQLARKGRITLRVSVAFTGVDLAARQQVVLKSAAKKKAPKSKGRGR